MFKKAVLIIFVSLIILIVIANLTYDPPPDSGKSQREIEGDFIRKANAMAQHMIEINAVHSARGNKILVLPDGWDVLSVQERLNFVRTWGRAKEMAQDFKGRIEVNSWADDWAGYPPMFYYDVGNDEFIYPER